MDKELIEQCNQYGFEIFSERRVREVSSINLDMLANELDSGENDTPSFLDVHYWEDPQEEYLDDEILFILEGEVEGKYCEVKHLTDVELIETIKDWISKNQMSSKLYRYYSLLRPISIGTIPSSPKPVNIVNFEASKEVEGLGHKAWGFVEYTRPLTKGAEYNYDLKAIK